VERRHGVDRGVRKVDGQLDDEKVEDFEYVGKK